MQVHNCCCNLEDYSWIGSILTNFELKNNLLILKIRNSGIIRDN